MNSLEVSMAVDDYATTIGYTRNIDDIAMLLESKGLVDKMYSMVAIGYKESDIADEFNLSEANIKYILNRTPDAQKKCLIAKSVYLGNRSLEELENYCDDKFMSNEQNNMASHHRKMAEISLKSVGGISSTGSGNIVVNNQTIINNKIPETPNDIKEIIDA